MSKEDSNNLVTPCKICNDELNVNGMIHEIGVCHPCADRGVIWAAANAFKAMQSVLVKDSHGKVLIGKTAKIVEANDGKKVKGKEQKGH